MAGDECTYKIKNLSCCNEMMKAIHDFLDAGRVVPPVEIENVDVVRAKLLQGRFDGEMQRLGAVSDIMRLLRNFLRCSTTLPRRGVLAKRDNVRTII